MGNRSKQEEYIKAVESSTGANRPVLDDEPSAYPYTLYFPWIPQGGGGAPIEPAAATVTNTISYTYDPLYRVTKANYSSPARTITYTYDAVGNRLIQGDAGKVTTYTYDIANRLMSAGGVAYTWDNNGNLLNDGKSAYSYDQANRLSKLVTGTQTYTMTYNGLGDRLTLSVNGTQTQYANDVGGGLTQVLVETTGATKNFYLYGNGHIAQQKTNVQYFGLDGLGSVRQLYNASGQIVSDRQFDPYGNQMSKTGVGTSIYGFAGEQMDGSGLVYLRARYYAPRQGRFLSEDTVPGQASVPRSLHIYAYAWNNPVNLIDPSGKQVPPPQCGFGDICYAGTHGPQVGTLPSFVPTTPTAPQGQTPDAWTDPRNLTIWLHREMVGNVNDSRLQTIRQLNTTGGVSKGLGAVGVVGGCATGLLPVALLSGGVFAAGGLADVVAGLQFYSLVADRRPWDFKHKILERLGPGITLCSSGSCKNDIEYSVPGNIHFGFVAKEAGYDKVLTQGGAGLAEIFDPAHNPTSPYYREPYNGKFSVGLSPFGGLALNLGDDPQDNLAIEFGARLHEKYGKNLTLEVFRMELNNAFSYLATSNPDPNPVSRAVADSWPYPPGYFEPTK